MSQTKEQKLAVLQKLSVLEEHRLKVLEQKAKEYATAEDRFRNLKIAAEFLSSMLCGEYFSDIFMILAHSSKHYASYEMMRLNEVPIDDAALLEKCGDFLNYCDDLLKSYQKHYEITDIALRSGGFNVKYLETIKSEIRKFFVENYKG